MYNLINNRALSALMISSIAMTTVACAHQETEDKNSLPEPTVSTNLSESDINKDTESQNEEPIANNISEPKDNHQAKTPDSVDTHVSSHSIGSGFLHKNRFAENPSVSQNLHSGLPESKTPVNVTLPLVSSLNSPSSQNTENTALTDAHEALYSMEKNKSNDENNKVKDGNAVPDEKDYANGRTVESSQDAAIDVVENLDELLNTSSSNDKTAFEIPEVSSKDDFDTVYAQWVLQKGEVENRLALADKAVTDATNKLHEKTSEHENLVARVNDAQIAFDRAKHDYEKAVKNQQISQAESEAQLKKNFQEAKQALSQAKANEANAQTALIQAQEDASRVQADKSKAVAKLEAIDAGIASLDKRIEANNVEKATLEAQKYPTKRTDFSADEYQVLVAQAVIEMVNAYRVENGVAPLRTHDTFNYSAQAWSEQMARDGKNVPASEFGDAFRHSPKTWGASGENIAGMYMGSPEQLEKRDWAYVPGELFELWRNSPAHNEAMLGVQAQGVGVGVVVDEHGRVWATTQFFKEDTQFTSGARVRMDKGTEQALMSGKDFYVAEGAMDVLDVNWTAPKDTKGVNPDYQYIKNGRASQEEKVRGLSHGVDDSVRLSTSGADVSQRAQIDSRIAQLDESNAQFMSQKNDAVAKKQQVLNEIDGVERAQDLADKRVMEAEENVSASRESVVQAELSVVDAQSKADGGVVNSDVTVEAEAIFNAAEQELVSLQDQLTESQATVDEAQSELTDALVSRSVVQEEYNTVVNVEPSQQDVDSGVEEVSFDD